MTTEQLFHIIQKGENANIEFKEAGTALPSSLYETVVAFSNTDGGVVLLGVDDSGKIIGVKKESVQKLQKDLVSALNTEDCVSPPIFIQPFVVNHPEGTVIVIQVPASSQVHRYKNDIYVREFEADIKITDNQQRVSDLYLRKRNTFSESTIYPYLQMSDLDDALFDKAKSIIRGYRSDHPWLFMDNEELLRSASLYVKDFQTGKEGLTLAAALIFGKDVTIQSLLPAYKVEALVRINNQDRWDDRIIPPLRTNLIDTYLLLKQFVNKHLSEKFYLEGDQRVDLRDKIFREVIANAIVHREYTSAYATKLLITDVEVTITNPNKPLFHGVIDKDNFNPYPKNPNLRKFFTALGWAEEIGSGVRNTNRYVPIYSDGAHPIFIENEIFTAKIPLLGVTFETYIQQFSEWLNLPKSPMENFAEGLANLELSSQLRNASWEQLLLTLVPSWFKKGSQLPEFEIYGKQILTKEEMMQVPNWQKNGIQLLGKKLWYLISILALCVVPISFNQILRYFQYKNEKSFRDNYLNPLRQLQFIKPTIPDKPTSPNNKYIITELGKSFICNE